MRRLSANTATPAGPPVLEELPGPFPLIGLTLANGLQVFLSTNQQEPVFHARIVVRAGSKHDPPGAGGAAHLLEHMLFKGSNRLGTLDFVSERPHLERLEELYEQRLHSDSEAQRRLLLEEIGQESLLAAQYAVANETERLFRTLGGAALNARTTMDATSFSVTMPRNRLEHWALIESERFRHPVFRLFQTELQVVSEERAKALDDKENLLRKRVLQQLFGSHPYGGDILGNGELLRDPSPKLLMRFFRQHYVATNMAIVICGDIDPEQAATVIGHHFSGWPAGQPQAPQPRGLATSAARGEVELRVTAPAEEEVIIGYGTVPQGHPDEYALLLADTILDNGHSGLLNHIPGLRAGARRIVRNECIVQLLHARPGSYRTLEEASGLLLEQVRKLAEGELSDRLLNAAVLDFRHTERRAVESNSGRADIISNSFICGLPWARRAAALDELSRVTKKEIARVARCYLGEHRVVGYRLCPARLQAVPDTTQEEDQGRQVRPGAGAEEIAEPGVRQLATVHGERSELGCTVMAMEARPITPTYLELDRDVVSLAIGEGGELLAFQNPVNDLFVLELVFARGREHDRLLPLAAELLLESGDGARTCHKVREAFYELGASVRVEVLDTSIWFRLEGPDESTPKAIALLLEWIQGFEPSSDTLDELVEKEVARRRQMRHHLASIQTALVEYSRLGARSQFVACLTEERLRSVRTDELKESWDQLLASQLQVGYVGVRPAQRVAGILRRRLLKVARRESRAVAHPMAISHEAPVLYLHHHDGLSRVYIRVQIPGACNDPRFRPYLQIYNEYLNGSAGSLIHQQLCELRGLAYSAWAIYREGADRRTQDVLSAGLGCRPGCAAEALTLMHDLIYTPPVSEQRFREAKHALIERYRISRIPFRRLFSTVRRWQQAGFSSVDPRRERLMLIEGMTADDLAWVPRERLAGRHMAISMVADRAGIELPELQRIARVEPVHLDDIFAY